MLKMPLVDEDKGTTYEIRDGGVHPKGVGYSRKLKQRKRRRDRQHAKRAITRKQMRIKNGLPPIIAETDTQELKALQRQWNEAASGVASWERDKGTQDELRLTQGEDRDMVGAVTDKQLAGMSQDKQDSILAEEALKQAAIKHRQDKAKLGKCVCSNCVKARQHLVKNQKLAEKR